MKARNFFKLAFAFWPEALMVFTGGIPKIIALIELTDDNEKFLASRLLELRKELKGEKFKVRIINNPAEAEKYWTMRRESFSLLRSKIKDKQTAPFIDDFIVLPEKLGEFLPQLYSILDPYKEKMIYTLAGHIGDGNFHIIPLVNLDDEEVKRSIPKLMELVYNLVLKFGGSITAEHNDGLVRSPYLEKMYGKEVYGMFETIKQIFDSENIFNPGKKVRSSLQYALNHIKSK
jgi:FAD/FMN-containing dehydrogenase